MGELYSTSTHEKSVDTYTSYTYTHTYTTPGTQAPLLLACC